jgi:hypothetical protein
MVLRGGGRGTFHWLMSLTAVLVGEVMVVGRRESRMRGLRWWILLLEGVSLAGMSE